MPHIVITASPNLAPLIDWPRVVPPMHHELATRGFAALNDLKTRVQACEYAMSGDDVAAGQVVATLLTTNPRTREAECEMANIVQSHLQRASIAVAGSAWIQCCVVFQHVPKAQYLKLEINSP